MKDHQLGFLPAEDDRMLGNVNAECIDEFGVGIPVRVLDEWQARHDAKMAEERRRRTALRERKVNTRCMTDGDTAGIMPKRPTMQLRAPGEPLTAASLTATMAKFFEAHAKSYEMRERKAVPMPIVGQLQLQYDVAQAQQNQAVQNAFTDSLLMPSVQLSQWRPR